MSTLKDHGGSSIDDNYFCANCSCPVSYSTEAATWEMEYIEFIVNSCFRKVTNINAIMELYRLSCKCVEFDLTPKLPLCFQCSGVLSDLYKLYERFNTLRKVGSIVSQLIASTELNGGSTLDNIECPDPDDHPPDYSGSLLTSSDKTDVSCEFLVEKSDGPVFQRDKDGNIGGKEIVSIETDSIIDIPIPNMLVLDGNDYDPSAQLGISDPEELDNSEESGCLVGDGDKSAESGIGIESNPSSLRTEAHGTETPVEFPRSTTAIAVPIGENLFQIYRVAPVLSKKPPFTCIQCGKVKKSLRSLRNHVHNVHDTHKFVSCPQCPKVFRKPCLLKRHLVVHDQGHQSGEKKFRKPKSLFTCTWPGCGRSFQYNASLRRHEARHRPERPFVCSDCNKGFKLIGDLRNHMEFHKEDRPYICDKCGKSYKVASNLNTHIVNVHTEEGRLKYNQYMRMKTREKRLNKMATEMSTKVDKNVDADIISEHVVHEDFPDFFVASEAEIGTEEITVEFS
ncbi:unnamed protein product [Allacma fusca]|uniref:C2H2-type domain-containing protein n=1 Tax=Allacma fusca TaxID=39272 RepID=A0A8J2KBN2_9HEXA|nr:unnamed protein product [Allacma fusca]